MPRFYFHVHDDIEALDEEGLELPHAKAAIDGAVHAARELAAEEVRHGELHLDHRVEVVDENGAVISTITFRDCVIVEG
jgi:hypothetical protein